ncbi:ATP-binding protein [Candidatus Vondammii sp. HM_W22]|uniref:ATP-binding protein n=1 Tax=Candidatus Vondammii sp. HM_W22 TaxID=2687299 RepID=UPI001F1359F4|nr:ATP-binding protein [Candidatus Vondammii sp. HM_W22]
MSLSLRIFLSFWLAMILLAGSFYLLQRFYGGELVERTEAVMLAKAEVAAVLWHEGGTRALKRWLRSDRANRRLVLVNQDGELQVRKPIPRHLRRWLPRPVSAGVERISEGHLMLAVALPEVTPSLFLVTELDPGKLHELPIWTRLLIAAIISGMVSLLLARVLTRQIRPLREAAQHMAQGDLSGRVTLSGRDEISALGRDFNLMAERLNDLLQSQRQLVSDVSHELRSPLARLRVALELAEWSDDRKKALSRIEKEADELERLIAELLSLARLESGQAGLERHILRLDDLVARVVTDADFEAQARGRQVVLAQSEAIEVKGDPVLLRSAVENVVRNAIRHTPKGSTVSVVLTTRGDQYEIEVRDSGSGVPEDQLQTIFDPFTRTTQARERGSGGAGLGLAIARRAMQAHGGGGRARNHPEGGLVVTLYLPLTLV